MKYVILENDIPKAIVQAKGFVPQNSIPAPEGIRDLSEVSIVDVIDSDTQQVMGKEAILDPNKVAAYDATLMAQADTAAWSELRNKRDLLLKETDFTQLADAPLTEQQKLDYSTYRQALRDLPANTVDPTSPNWPVKPS